MRIDLKNVVIAQLTDGSTRYIGPMCIMADFIYNESADDLKYIFLEKWNHECDTCGIYKIMVLHQENDDQIFVSDPMNPDPTMRALNKKEIKYKEVAFDIRNLCPIDFKKIKSMEIFDQSEQHTSMQDKLKSLKQSASLINQNFKNLQTNAPKNLLPHESLVSVRPVEAQSLQPEGFGDSLKKITDKFGIKQCKGCAKRQTWLNKLFPYKKNK